MISAHNFSFPSIKIAAQVNCTKKKKRLSFRFYPYAEGPPEKVAQRRDVKYNNAIDTDIFRSEEGGISGTGGW